MGTMGMQTVNDTQMGPVETWVRKGQRTENPLMFTRYHAETVDFARTIDARLAAGAQMAAALEAAQGLIQEQCAPDEHRHTALCLHVVKVLEAWKKAQ